ncbi:unnamed protein product [Danaus chrysippus]|uniref:(African queen) hypothetical protein n=1 Tax=Danaus chrysippus TaxID=151541 RepID=A0A8J2RBJ0_9NEOP|nr:unnamed protein product [Danaus chrysippus]
MYVGDEEGAVGITIKGQGPRQQEVEARQCENQDTFRTDLAACEALDLLANCKISDIDDVPSEGEYAEIDEMGVWHSTLAQKHKSKVSLTWILKDIDKTEVPKTNNYERPIKQINQNKKAIKEKGRNDYNRDLRFKTACEEFANIEDSCSDTSVATEEYKKKHRHRHRRRKKRFGYDIRDLDTFLTEATIDRPGNIPVVIAFPTTLYQTQKELQRELTLPLGTVVNAVFKNQQWLYTQTPHGDEGYVMYSACLPLGILPRRSSLQKKAPCWESSTDIYPKPCGNLTDNEKEQLRGRTRSESRYRHKTKRHKSCAEKNFDNLYLRTISCSNLHDKENRKETRRQTLLVINSAYTGSYYNRTLTVNKGEVVVLMDRETDVDLEWFYVKKRDGSEGFIPAAIAGHGYI